MPTNVALPTTGGNASEAVAIKDQERVDDRQANQIRPIGIELGVVGGRVG
jgi:exosome complex RNA-binding protein Rrp42 (RNase PH superfamily)